MTPLSEDPRHHPLSGTTMVRAHADEGAFDLHHGDVVIALSRDENGAWWFWDVSLPGLPSIGKHSEIRDDRAIAALDGMFHEIEKAEASA